MGGSRHSIGMSADTVRKGVRKEDFLVEYFFKRQQGVEKN